MNARQRLAGAVVLFLALVGSGTAGYHFIEGWDWFDALYHTIITLSTIGYQELHPMSSAGRAFTIVLVVFSVVGTALAIQAVTSLVIEGDFGQLLWRRKMQREIAGLENHVVVCGHGRMGRLVADSLRRAGQSVVVVERDPESARDAVEAGHLVVEGDATSDEQLLAARADHARCVICALPSDADNVFTALSLRVINPDVRVIARHDAEATREKLLRAGANAAVSPVLMGGHRVVNMVLRPAATELLELAVGGGDLDLRLEEFVVRPESRLCGRKLVDSHLRDEHDAMVVAVRGPLGQWIYNPPSNLELEAGATVVVIGRGEGMADLLARERPASP